MEEIKNDIRELREDEKGILQRLTAIETSQSKVETIVEKIDKKLFQDNGNPSILSQLSNLKINCQFHKEEINNGFEQITEKINEIITERKEEKNQKIQNISAKQLIIYSAVISFISLILFSTAGFIVKNIMVLLHKI